MPQRSLPAPLFQTLAAVADRLAGAAEPWWVIGSAAAALHGLEIATVGDVDVLASIADARRLLSVPDAVTIDDGGNDIFRSDAFVRLTGLPLKVEVLGGLRVRGDLLTIATRVTIPIGKTTVYVPSREELVRIFRLFGRRKDMARAEALAALA